MSHGNSRRRGRSLRHEPLETRVLLTINAPYVNGSADLVINGPETDDLVSVAEISPGILTVGVISGEDFVTTTFEKSAVSRVIYRGGGGDDSFVNLTGIPSVAYGGAGNDVLTGGSGRDSLYGQDGNDVLNGGLGDDRLIGGSGADSLNGGAGDDTLEGNDGHDNLSGGLGNDVLKGGEGNDRLTGDAGKNTLYGENGDDTLIGGDGNDVLFGADGDDRLEGAGGDDRILGGLGNDGLYGNAGDDHLEGGEGHDYIDGGSGNDLLKGGAGNDRMTSLSGRNTFYGEGGDDFLYGGDGDDTLRGNDGVDLIKGRGGNDLIFGGAGDDFLYGEAGNDEINGEEGNDYVNSGADDDILRGGEGDDRLISSGGQNVFYGNNGSDYLTGATGAEVFYGGPGNDLIKGYGGDDLIFGGDGNDDMHGGDGDDKLNGEAGADYLSSGTGDDILNGGADDDKMRSNGGRNIYYGEDGADLLFGANDADVFYAGSGNDTVAGGGGKDLIFGGPGNDNLYGEGGDDEIHGEEGADYVNGGVGDDILKGGDDDDHIRVSGGQNTLYGNDGNDHLIGASGNDSLYGGNGDDVIEGASGNDLLFGELGNDTLLGGDGNDNLSGFDGNDYLDGGAGDDSLRGEEGDDTLVGGGGNDFLQGASGNDYLDGGEGDDVLRGDSGKDFVIGGAGVDLLFGGQERDILVGGTGVDVINGEEGDDALVGGSGDDQLNGGSGNDLLIGGADKDWVFGHEGDDLLIGGVTHYDSNLLALDRLLNRWSAPMDYHHRVAKLSSSDEIEYFELMATVHEDQSPDELIGGSGQDWYFVTGAASIYDPLASHGGNESADGENPPMGHDNAHMAAGHHGANTIVTEMPMLEGFALVDALDNISDRTADEAMTSLIPHADDARKRREHLTLFELVRYQDVTHTAVANGDWSDPAIWHGGIVPSADSRVLIPINVEVTVNEVIAQSVFTVRIDGTLRFATDVDTSLRVDTMIVSPVGRLEIGTASNPINANVSAQLTFTDSGAIDRNWDPFGISRGLITHGSVEMYGTRVQSYAELDGSVSAGSSVLQLAAAPVGWKPGDQIVIGGAHAGEQEVRTIQEVFGRWILVEPLAHDHAPLTNDLGIHVTNLTRNIVIDSNATDIARKGHVMFMHNRDVHIDNVSFQELGRTNKFEVINDSVVDASWNLTSGTGTNQRARYAVHFHRNGTIDDGSPSTVRGSSVIGGAGWGYVNHSSYVDFTGNVAYGLNGAGFVTEVGDEVGRFEGNLAIATRASGDDVDSRVYQQDFGHTGDGFWLQGAGVRVTNNISIGNEGSGFIYYTKGLNEGGKIGRFNAVNLANPSLGDADGTIAVDDVPVAAFENNVAYASSVGLTVRYHLRNATHNQQSVFEDSTFWNNTTGIDLPYANQTILRRLQVLHEFVDLPQYGVNGNAVTKNITYDDLTVLGYTWGINVARGGTSVIQGGTFGNRYNIVVNPGNLADRLVIVTGDITFSPLPARLVGAAGQFEVVARFDDLPDKYGSIEHLFRNDRIFLSYGPYTGQELFYSVQAPDAVPFSQAKPHIPSEYVGLTSQQLKDQFGIAIGGQLSPRGLSSPAGIAGNLAPS